MADNTYDDLYDSNVVDEDGNKIGSVGQVYLDDQSGLPTWVTVRTGFFGTRETFIPLQRAIITDGQIQVPYQAKFVKDAPNVDPDRHLDAAEEADLYQYFGFKALAADPSPEAETVDASKDGEVEAEQNVSVEDNSTPEVVPPTPADAQPNSDSDIAAPVDAKPAETPKVDAEPSESFGDRVNKKYDETASQPAIKGPDETSKLKEQISKAWDGVEADESSPKRGKLDPYNAIQD